MRAETKEKIEKHIRKHRASGGKAEAHEMHAKGKGAESADRGTDDAEKDIKDKPGKRNLGLKVFAESEAKRVKKGGRVERKEGGKAEGHMAHHHAGRKARASGGYCSEDNPFTTANKGTPAKGRKIERESEGRDA
jgi:hypothetical protein